MNNLTEFENLQYFFDNNPRTKFNDVMGIAKAMVYYERLYLLAEKTWHITVYFSEIMHHFFVSFVCVYTHLLLFAHYKKFSLARNEALMNTPFRTF